MTGKFADAVRPVAQDVTRLIDLHVVQLVNAGAAEVGRGDWGGAPSGRTARI